MSRYLWSKNLYPSVRKQGSVAPYGAAVGSGCVRGAGGAEALRSFSSRVAAGMQAGSQRNHWNGLNGRSWRGKSSMLILRQIPGTSTSVSADTVTKLCPPRHCSKCIFISFSSLSSSLKWLGLIIQHCCLYFVEGGAVLVSSDFAVWGQLSQCLHDFGEGGPFFEAERPAARHQLVDPGWTSVWDRQLQFSSL